MSPLPAITGAPKPPMPAPKKKTSIRTVPKAAQQQFLQRLRTLRENPLDVLPICTEGEPKNIAKIRSRITKMQGGKPGFLDKRDAGIVGAVAHAWSVADQEEVPRMLDAKVGGQRRFYVQRGQVERAATLGVQNYDHSPSLLMAYRSMAKKEGMHFFAQPKLWCTGDKPRPPAEWWDALAERGKIPLQEDGDNRTCGHEDRGQVILEFRDGPQLRVCAACSKGNTSMHALVGSRYAGPRQRQPVRVKVLAPDGQVVTPSNEEIASYRAGIDDEGRLIKKALIQWKPKGTTWMLRGKVHTNIDAWIARLGAEAWEEIALRAMAPNGFSGDAAGVSEVLDELGGQLVEGVTAIMGHDGTEFAAKHARMSKRDLLRAANDQASAEAAVAGLPKLVLGPVGRFFDDLARAYLSGGKSAALIVVRGHLESGDISPLHLWIALQAIGGDLGLESRIGHDNKAPAEPLQPLANEIFKGTGSAYQVALATYLQESGTGEAVTSATR